jgi:O-methyltransferase involved in polyketide biosynthesis
VTRQGISQFIDVGAGLPTVLNTHDVAQHAHPSARVAYVDNDPMVVSHACAILANDSGVVVVPGDLRDPASILGHRALNSVIDASQPVGLVLAGVLHFLPAGTARDVVATFAERIAPGSYLIISVGSGQGDVADRFAKTYTASSLYVHGRDEIVRLFDRLELVGPGLVEARTWTDGGEGPADGGDAPADGGDSPADGGDGPAEPPPREGTFLAAVARKPA